MRQPHRPANERARVPNRVEPGLPPWGTARPLPPSADIGRGGQSVGSTSPNARRCTRSRLICRRRSSRISNCRTGWRARRERGLMRRSSARCRTIAKSTRTPGGTTGFGRLIHYRDVFDKRSWTRLSPALLVRYEQHRRGGYAGREQAWAQQEADILRVAAEGRVLNPDNITK